MSLPYQFKRLSLDHLTEMMAIERQVFRSPWSASVMRDSMLAAHTQAWGMVTESGELIGFGVISVVLDEVELLTMSLHPKFHRQGFGDKLMRFLVDQAKKAKAENLYLEVNAKNTPAIEFYRNFGFKNIGLRKGYYPVPGSTTDFDDAQLLMLEIMDFNAVNE